MNLLEWFYQIRYVETSPTNQNSNQEEIKGRLKTENAAIIRAEYFVFQFAIQKYSD
jgi:hypothetical protein